MTDLILQEEVMREVIKIMNSPDFKRYKAEVENLVVVCKKVKVRNDEDAEDAVEKRSQIRGLIKRIEEVRKDSTARSRLFVDGINKAVGEWTKPLKEGSTHIDEELRKHHKKMEMKRREEEEKQRKQVEKMRESFGRKAEKIGIDAPDLPDPIVPKKKGIKSESGKVWFKKAWKARLVDIKELAKAVGEGKAMSELLLLNESLANSLAKNGVRFIPGVEIYEEDQIAGRSA